MIDLPIAVFVAIPRGGHSGDMHQRPRRSHSPHRPGLARRADRPRPRPLHRGRTEHITSAELLPAASASPRRRFTVNITPAERVGRVVVGATAAIAAVVLLTGAGSVLAVALETLLAAAGLDLVVTGALGHCPLYHRLGYVPRSMRSTR